jgi:hypothetical protein
MESNDVHFHKIILSRLCVCETVDGVCISELIYWPLVQTTRNYTSNYTAITNLHLLQITTAPAKSFPA